MTELTVKPKKLKQKRLPTEADLLMWTHLSELHEKGITVASGGHYWPYIFQEYKFCETRRWRLDFALEGDKGWIGIEIEGGAFTRGRHTRGMGFVKDMEKYNEATRLGIRVLRFTPQQVLNGEAISFIKKLLES